MTHLTGLARARYVQNMFARIAGRYDLMNRLMTAGQDVRWRKQVIRLADLPAGGRLLDLGTGTGDLAREALWRTDGRPSSPNCPTPNLHVIGADFTIEMMRVGQRRPGGSLIHWAGADALNLPFPDGVFEAVISGFLMRNVIDVDRALAEKYRVLKPGGRIVCLDTTPPPRSPLRPFITLHLRTVIPLLGRLISGEADTYTYLPDSTVNFLPVAILAEKLVVAGFKGVKHRRLMLGTIAIHWGQK